MIRLAIGLILAVYPLLIFWLHGSVEPVLLIAVLGIFAGWRIWSLPGLRQTQRFAATVAIIAFCVVASLDAQLRALKFYPVLINLGALIFFAYTLRRPPSAIARISHRLGMAIEGPAVGYTRRLTWVWLAFFAANALVAIYTAVATSTKTWALYNGLISYVLIGLLLVLEYPVRLAYIKRHEGRSS